MGTQEMVERELSTFRKEKGETKFKNSRNTKK